MKPAHTLSWLALALGAIFLAACSLIPGAATPQPTQTPAAAQSDALVIAEGRLVPRDWANLFFTAGGKVAEVLVEEGDTVAAGDVLARLGDRESFAASLSAAQLELADAQKTYDDLHTTADLAYRQAALDVLAAERAHVAAQQKLEDEDADRYEDDLDKAEDDVATARQDLDDAQEDFDKYKDLDEDNANRKRTKDALDTAQDKYDDAVHKRDLLINTHEQLRADVEMTRARLEDTERRRDERKDGPAPDELALVEARLANARAQVAAAQAALDRLDLKAPFAGTIVKVDIAVGEQALPNQAVMMIADFSSWYAETTELTEHDVVRIQAGQAVTLIPDALSDLALAGKVDRIGDYYTEKAGDITYKTRILLTESDPRLKWGMTVQIHFATSTP